MFDWLRGLTHSAETRRQERTIAYVDGTLSEKDRLQFEAEMARDAVLRQDVDELRQIKGALASMPRQRVPRNFTLDPAVYGKPAPAYDARFYPVLQAATALSALVFIIFATLTYLPGFGVASERASAPTALVVEQAADTADGAADSVAAIEATVANTHSASADAAEEASVAENSAEMDQPMAEAEIAEAEMSDEPASVAPPVEDAAASSAMVEESAAAGSDNMLNMQSDDAMADDAMMDESDSAAASGAAASGAAPEPAASPPRSNIVVIPSSDEPAAETEFRALSPEELESMQFQETVAAEAVSAEPAVEISASETAPDSKTSVKTEDVAVETVNSAEQDVTQSSPFSIWMLVLGVLFIALLATTLWVRSRL